MEPQVSIFITTTFEGVHRWADAPDGDVEFLRFPHRHLFHVRIEVLVAHDERQIEFLTFKSQVDDWLFNNLSWANVGLLELSCEAMARMLWTAMNEEFGMFPVSITVSEDGENGATVQLPNVQTTVMHGPAPVLHVTEGVQNLLESLKKKTRTKGK